jgi:hypothetical protein
MVTYPYMPFFEYTWLASTFRAPELGHAELGILEIFAHSKSQSVYGIFKELKMQAKSWRRERSSAYKDIHKRVKRLLHLKLVDQIKEHFERGAKHYKITPYGLIAFLSKVISESAEHIVYNKENIVIRSLLFECVEEETVDSFRSLKEFPTEDIRDYLHDCCSMTADICREFWTKIQRYNIIDILPDDYTIQKYMSYLDGKSVDQNILDEIRKYEKRLSAKIGNDEESNDKQLANAVDNYDKEYFSDEGMRYYKRYKRVRPQIRNYVEERPPFPLLDIFHDIVWDLSVRLEDKTKLLAFHIVSILGDIINSFKIKNQDELEKIFESARDYSLPHLLKDKRFIEIVRAVKEEFDTGYKQFLYYH